MADLRAIRLAAGVLALLLPSMGAAEVPAVKPAGTPAVIVVVDASRVQRESLAGKAVAAERERYQQSFNGEFEAARKSLQTAEQDLARQRSSLAADVFQVKVRALNVRIAEFQRQYQGAVRPHRQPPPPATNCRKWCSASPAKWRPRPGPDWYCTSRFFAR